MTLDANGKAAFSTQNLIAGTYTLTAVYNSDQNFSTVISPVVTFQVIPPSVLITANPPSLTIRAGVPTQTVLTFGRADIQQCRRADGYGLRNGDLHCGRRWSRMLGNAAIINVNADGTAPFPTNCLTINTSNNQIPNLTTTYTITPLYSGNSDPNYATMTGTP